MAFTQDTTTTTTLSASGSNVFSHATGASAKYVVVLLARSVSSVPASAVTIDGQALTLLNEQTNAYFGGFQRSAQSWFLADPPAGGTYDIEVTMNDANSTIVSVFSGTCGGIMTLADNDGASPAVNGSYSFSMDSGLVQGLMFGAKSDGGSYSPGSAMGDLTIVQAGVGSANAVQAVNTIGVRGFGIGGTKSCGVALLLTEEGVIAEPTRFGVEVGFNTPTVGNTGPQYIEGDRIRAVVVGFRSGLRLGSTSKRQVALVGEDIETSEMTAGGSEGDILVQHADVPPTWEPPSAHAHSYSGELLITDEPAGSPLVFADILQNEAEDDLLYEDVNP